MDTFQLLSFMFVFSGMFFKDVRTDCPNDYPQRSAKCFDFVLPSDKALPIPGGGTNEGINRMCTNKKYLEAIRCTIEANSYCSGVQRQLLDAVFTKTNFNPAWAALCNQKNVYLRALPCFHQVKDKLVQCLKAASLAGAQIPYSNLTQGLQYLCSVVRNKTLCEKNAFDTCNTTAASIIVDFDEKTVEPACNYTTTSLASSHFIGVALVMIASLPGTMWFCSN